MLSHPQLRGDERLVSRRVAVERESAGEFPRRGHLRRAGNGLILVVYLPPPLNNLSREGREGGEVVAVN